MRGRMARWSCLIWRKCSSICVFFSKLRSCAAHRFLYVTVFALFMLLPMCCPFCVVPICGYCGAKHQDRGMLRFVNCQHGTGAIGGTLVILYCLYKLIGSMSDAGVSADDVSDAASHARGACDYTSACSWALAFVCWSVLLLTLHWCAFCAGYAHPLAHAVCRRRLRGVVCLQS